MHAQRAALQKWFTDLIEPMHRRILGFNTHRIREAMEDGGELQAFKGKRSTYQTTNQLSWVSRRRMVGR